MFILAFVGTGLFASAGNGKASIKKEKKHALLGKSKLTKSTSKPTVYELTGNCGVFTVHVCCFATYAAAVAYANTHNCASYGL